MNTLGHRVRFIRSFFKWTHDEGFINQNPAAKLKEPKLGKRIPKCLTELEIEHPIIVILKFGIYPNIAKP
jgi:site-specific recombinase XerD